MGITHSIIINNVKKKLYDVSEQKLKDYKRSVLIDAYNFSVSKAESYGYEDYKDYFRFSEQTGYFGKLRYSDTQTLDEILSKVNNSYNQVFFMSNVATNPDNGYMYSANVEELGWSTKNVFTDKSGKLHFISSKHPFSPKTPPKRILEQTLIYITRG